MARSSYLGAAVAILAALISIVAACTPRAGVDASVATSAASTAGYGFRQNLPLDSFGVVGIAEGEAGALWVSDADGNRLIVVNARGEVTDTVEGYDRPMHISAYGGGLAIAEYGADRVVDARGTPLAAAALLDSLDAPSGVSVVGDRVAVADFYNHRIAYAVGGVDRSFGTKGTGPGELTYPTDAQFAHDKLWVADAYNHRVQVFDLDGEHLFTFGEADGINAATGIFVGEAEVFVTDFENSRVLVYGLDGALRGTLDEGLDKPTDVLLRGDSLYVVNYAGRSLSLFTEAP